MPLPSQSLRSQSLSINVLCVVILALAATTAVALAMQDRESDSVAVGEAECKTVIVNITSTPDEVLKLTTAFQVANEAIDSGRHVVLLFNGRGVLVPLKRLSRELRLGDDLPLWIQLNDLIARGAEVVVSPESAKMLDLVVDDFVASTQVPAWGQSTFSKFTRDTVVFSY